MRAITLTSQQNTAEALEGVAQERTKGRPLAVGLIVAGGVASIAAAALTFNLATAGGSTPAPATRPAAVAAPAPADPTRAPGFPDVGTARAVYQRGHTSGWHLHPGVHSVVVLSGTLTIYDSACVRTDYGPDETYLGGNAPHLARNEGSEPIDLAITYVYTPGNPLDHGSVVAAPTGCEAR